MRSPHTAGSRLALRWLALILLLTPLLAVARPQPAAAAGVVSQCTEAALRVALMGGGVVTITCGGVIPLTSQLEITQDTIIDGNFVTLDGQGATRLIHIGPGAEVELLSLRLINGNGNGESGGAIYNEGSLTVLGSQVESNTAAAEGGAIFNIGGTVTIFASVLSDNRASIGGALKNLHGAVTIDGNLFLFNSAESDGGAIDSVGGTLLVRHTTFFVNEGGAGGAISSLNDATIIASSFEFNRASQGGAVLNVAGPMTITASTFAGNSASEFGGATILNVGGLALSFNTIASSSAILHNEDKGQAPGPTALLSANILAGGSGADCVGPGISSDGYNVGSDASCNLTAVGDIQNANPLLGPLAANGGPSNTYLPQAGSPVLERVPNHVCVTLAAANDGQDQRGAPRPEAAGLPCDSGSVELQVNSFFCIGERSGSLRYVSAPNGCLRGEYRLMPTAEGEYAFCVGDRSGSMRYLADSGASCLRGESKQILPRIAPITICVGERSRSVRLVAGGSGCLRGELQYEVVNPAG